MRLLKIVLLTIILLILYSCEGKIYSPWEVITTQKFEGHIYSVYFVDRDNGWACGDFPAILLNYKDGKWNKISIPNPPEGYLDYGLYSIFFNSINDGWTVGYGNLKGIGLRGVIFHWNGDKWEDRTPQPYSDVYPLTCVFFPTPDEGWAGSEGGRLYHYVNGQWLKADELPMNIYGLWFNARDDGWAVGDPEGIFHWNGYFWQIYYYNPGATNCGYFDICFPDSEHGWVLWFSYLMGYYISAIFHYNKDEGWKLDTPDLALQGGFKAISFSDYNDGWLVGGKWSYHWDGNTWTEVPVPTLYDKAGLNDVFAISPDDVWAVGDWGTILHFTGWK